MMSGVCSATQEQRRRRRTPAAGVLQPWVQLRQLAAAPPALYGQRTCAGSTLQGTTVWVAEQMVVPGR